MLLEVFEEIGKWVAAIGVIGGAILWLHKKIIKPTIKNFNQWQDAIEKIGLEFQPNGGSTIRDSLNRLEQNVAKLRGANRVLLLDYEEGIWETDAKGHCTYVNRTYERMVDRSFSELQNNGWHQVIHPDDLDEVSRRWHQSVEQEREFDMVFRYIRPDGTVIKVRAIANPIRDSSIGGTVLGYLGRSAIIEK